MRYMLIVFLEAADALLENFVIKIIKCIPFNGEDSMVHGRFISTMFELEAHIVLLFAVVYVAREREMIDNGEGLFIFLVCSSTKS